MIIRDFLNWVKTAPDGPRAEAAGALARAWLYSDLSAEDRQGASVALTLLLDDPCNDVRRALSENLSRSHKAPIHVIRCLAGDVDDVSEPVLACSPLLDDMELVDFAANGSSQAQAAIAQRPGLSAGLSAALCEIGHAPACIALLDNPGAIILSASLDRLGARFAKVADIRSRLQNRKDTPLIRRYTLLQNLVDEHGGTADSEGPEVQVPAFSREDAADHVILQMASTASNEEMTPFVQHLRDQARLNTRLLLRAVCCGRLRFFAAALGLLGGVPASRLQGTLLTIRPTVLQAVLRKAGLPMRSHPVFLTVVRMIQEAEIDFSKDLPSQLTRMLAEGLLDELQDESLEADLDVLAFVRRFAAEAARLEARAYMERVCRPALEAA